MNKQNKDCICSPMNYQYFKFARDSLKDFRSPSCRLDNQRKGNSSKAWEIFGPAAKISEILEPVGFPKSSKISEILEPLGSPQEAF